MKYSFLIFFNALIALSAHSQTPPIVQGTGIVGFADSDSVLISRNATDSSTYSAIYVHSRWPEMSGKLIWGLYVVPCLADSAGWYKIVFTEYQFTPEGEYLSMPPYIAYVQHSKWIEYQSWDTYMTNKYIYWIDNDVSFYSQPNESSPFVCEQHDCISSKAALGEWLQVTTIPDDDCSQFGSHCLQNTWFKWHDADGTLNLRLVPFY